MKIILPRKVLIFSTVILFVNIGFVSGLTSSDVLILDTGNNLGDTLYVGGNDPSSYSTIQSAIDAAKSGDTIFVYDDLSPYYENLAIGKSINLLGENKYTTIINGGGLADVVYLTIDHININGFSIQNSGNNVGISINSDYNKISDNIFNGHKYGIRLDYSHKNIVSGNTIMNNNNYGIYLYDSSDNNIHENTITDSPICIQLGHSSINNTIYGNDIVSNDIGINIEDSSYNNVYWNIIQDGQYGIYSIDSSNNFIYDDNIITNNQFGIYFHHSSQSSVYGGNTIVNNENYGIYLYDSSSINIHENDITNNKHGINLNVSTNNDIYWNNIKYNNYGIYSYHSSNNDIYLNNIVDNYQYGLYLFFSSNSKITYNNFIVNYKPAYFKQELFSFNTWKKNYWDNWNGVGPHKINGEIEGIITLKSWLNFDLRPVKQPYEI